MSIGVLALVLAGFSFVICLFGIGKDEKPAPEEKKIKYPEIIEL